MLFDRKKYKSFARIQLHNRFFVPAVITVISLLVTWALRVPTIFNAFDLVQAIINNAPFANLYAFQNFVLEFKDATVSKIAEWLLFFVEAIFLLAHIFVYLKMSRSADPISFDSFFEGMSLWFRACIGAIYKQFFLALWTLLFFFPGLVKYYAYSQMFFVLAEFPHISISKALSISKKITYGFKMDLFVLDLSFLAWYLLSLITGGIALIWILPYVQMTKTNAYHALMKNAFETNMLSREDLEK